MKHIALALCLIAAAPALASDAPLADHEIAQDAMLRGEILPLVDILERLAAVQPGAVIEVEIEIEDGLRIYEIELISPDGRILEVDIDAGTGEILSLEEDDDDDDDEDD